MFQSIRFSLSDVVTLNSHLRVAHIYLKSLLVSYTLSQNGDYSA